MHQEQTHTQSHQESEVVQQANPEITQQGEALLSDLSALDSMIDKVLEEDAEQFIEQFRQKGGE